ncbi:UBP-type zinc finger domain-containing protein [Acidiferrimicrobium sp. IK]|uniref:UBP-type zinc finger domain-containing protein n=1 Tax=Acidiferrimicrobium sp. IK TaxID=2871700 RepID=UPI0021CB5C51|nr:UBP-type zinc finger domain-containing protein [Acidiferrimicrobium sp. IK]MCU4183389.1 UBP-type zinc finger domain-containing protein [Acidiferrimicrobium sp. IK]
MSDTCSHLDQITTPSASGDGCVECLATGGQWVHLRRCASCGHVGCCDSSPGTHATVHFRDTGHPVMQSYEPGEDWYWCYLDEVAFELPADGPSPSHPA